MATDILGIAFKADTSDLKKGANELDKIAVSGTKAGKSAEKLTTEFKKTSEGAAKASVGVDKVAVSSTKAGAEVKKLKDKTKALTSETAKLIPKAKALSQAEDLVANSETKAARAARKLKEAHRKTGKETERTTRKVNALSTGLRQAATNAAAFEGPLGGVSGRLGAMSTLLASTNPLMVGFGLAVSAATVFMVGAVKEHDKLEIRNKKTAALLKATGFAAGFAAHELDAMAKAVALNTLASVEGAKDAQNVLLTFKSISEDVFKDSLVVAQDLAAVMGGDIKSAAMQLGKALEDPIAGLNALKRSGVSFSQSEKDLIKNMVAVGNAAGAQAFMLKTLKDQIGGAGSAEADTLSGAVDTLSQNWQTLMTTIADTSGAASGAKSFISLMAEAAAGWNNLLFTPDDRRFSELAHQRAALVKEISDLKESGDTTFFSTNVDLINTAEIGLAAVNAEMSELQDKKKASLILEKEANDAKESRDKAIKSATTGDISQTAIPKQSFGSYNVTDFLREQAEEEVRINEEKNDKINQNNKELADKKAAMDQLTISTTADLFGNLASIAAAGGEDSFTTYKRMAQAQAAVSAALAITNALAAPTGNPILNGAMAFSMGALAAVQIAQIEQQQYTGARAMGGQVSSGQSYVVGEQGREIITMGSQGGFVTPNHKMGGGESVTVVNQIGNGVQGNTRAEVMAMLPSIIAATSKAARSSRR